MLAGCETFKHVAGVFEGSCHSFRQGLGDFLTGFALIAVDPAYDVAKSFFGGLPDEKADLALDDVHFESLFGKARQSKYQ
jgi:hypothetical protein